MLFVVSEEVSGPPPQYKGEEEEEKRPFLFFFFSAAKLPAVETAVGGIALARQATILSLGGEGKRRK